MKKITAIILAALMAFAFAAAETNLDTGAVTISLDANPTTGFSWTGFVLGGDSVILTSETGTYIADPAPEMTCGSGGKTYFTIIPVKPGESIITFTYARPWEDGSAGETVILAEVDEDMNLIVSDVTEGGVIEGTVVSIDADEHSAVLSTEAHGEILAMFDAEAQLPAADEHIIIYTNGIMTMSLPAIMNVIAWSAVPGDLAR